MGRRRKGAPPAYRLHRGKGLAYCTVGGKTVYLGKYGTPESKRKYREIVKAFEQENPHEPIKPRPGCKVASLVASWVEANLGRLSEDEQRACKRNYADLIGQYGEWSVNDFGPREFKTLRQAWAAQKLRRQTVNKQAGRVRRLFRWGVSDGIVSPTTLVSLEAVKDLLEGEADLDEYEEVLPVPLRDFARTLKACPPVLADMLRVGYYLGCRPGELCRMRVSEIDRQGVARLGRRVVRVPGAWVFSPGQHKNAKKGRKVRHLSYVVGPRARRILAPHLEGKGPDEYVWQLRKRSKDHYLVATLDNLVKDICESAGIPGWSVGQLRHSFLTRADAAFGLQDASAAVGHARPDVTFGYLEKNLKRAAEVASRLG